MTIVIDSREPLKKVNDIIPKTFPEYTTKMLPNGDYLLQNENTLLLERKNISDFLSTYYDLRARLYRMKQDVGESGMVGLIIEGSPKVKNGGCLQFRGSRGSVCAMSYKAFQRFLMREQNENCLMFHTEDLDTTLQLIAILHDYLPELSKPRAIGCKAANLITLVPGIGEKKAEEISKQYASPIEAFENIRFWLPAKSINTLGHW